MIFSLNREQSEFHPSTAQRRLDRYRALLAGIEAAEVRSIAGGASLDFDRASYALERLIKAQIEFADAQLAKINVAAELRRDPAAPSEPQPSDDPHHGSARAEDRPAASGEDR